MQTGTFTIILRQTPVISRIIHFSTVTFWSGYDEKQAGGSCLPAVFFLMRCHCYFSRNKRIVSGLHQQSCVPIQYDNLLKELSERESKVAKRFLHHLVARCQLK